MPHTQATALSLKQLNYLQAVSETLNFTRAAEMCFVTQSTLSGGIAELERTLGVQLVERDRQRVALTPAGTEVVRRAQGILSAANDLISRAQMAADPASGEFHLGIIPTIAPYVLGKILMAARTRFPDLQLNVRESQTRVLLEEVENGELDAAVIALPVELGKLHAQVLFDEQLQLVAHQNDSLSKGPTRALNEIDTRRLLLLEKGHCLRDHTVSACNTNRSSSVSVPGESAVVQATNLSTMVQLVNSGIGCALLPDMAIQAGILQGTEVRPITLTAPQPSRTIALATRSSHPKLAFIEQQLGELIRHCKTTA